ncbi:mitochondrial inner membrane protein Mitofilin [Chytriomyces sp. MP71]|nr:mitochondrial inner membrane protein Mitofilin [Chytriomyces sp. MP71]
MHRLQGSRRLLSTGASGPGKKRGVVVPLLGVAVVGGGAYSGAALYAESNASFKKTWVENGQYTGGQAGIDAVVAAKKWVLSIDPAQVQAQVLDAQRKAVEQAEALRRQAEAAAAEAARVASSTSASVRATASDAAKFVENATNTVTSTYETTAKTVSDGYKTVADTANSAFETIEGIRASIFGPSSTPPPSLPPTKAPESAVVKKVEPVKKSTPPPPSKEEDSDAAALAEIAAAEAATVVVAEKKAEKEKETTKKESKSKKESKKDKDAALPALAPEIAKILDSHSSSETNPALAEQLSLLAQNLDSIKPSSKTAASLDAARGVLLDLARALPTLASPAAAATSLSQEEAQRALEQQAERFLETLGRQNEAALAALSEQEHELAQVFDLALAERARAHEAALAALRAEHENLFDGRVREAVQSETAKIEAAWERKVKELVDTERDGRLARLDHLAVKLKHLEQVAVQSGEFVEKMQGVQNVIAALQVVSGKVHDGGPFKKEFTVLKDFAEGDEVLTTVLAAIDERAQKDGVLSIDELREDFYNVSQKIRRVQLMPENGGPVSYGVSHILSYLMLQKHGLVAGNDTEAVLARSKYYLAHGDLEGAAREINQLKGWSKVLAGDWLRDARTHLEVKQALEVRFPFLCMALHFGLCTDCSSQIATQTAESHVALKNLGVV